MLSCVFECGPVEVVTPDVDVAVVRRQGGSGAVDPVAPAADAVGVALGTNDLATICHSRGRITVVRSEKWLRRAEKRLKRLQRSVERCKRGSNRRARAKRRLANLHRVIRNQRLDRIHKATTTIIRMAGQITIETLPVRKMMGDPRFAKALADSGLGEFLRQIKYKAEWHGRTVTEASLSLVGARVCSTCGHRNEDRQGGLERETFVARNVATIRIAP